MSRVRHSRTTTAVVLAATGIVLAVGVAAGQPSARAEIRGGTTLTASVIGEKPENRCVIAGSGIEARLGIVRADGGVELTVVSVPEGRHRVRVLCEDPARGDISVHTVGAEATVYVGPMAPLYQALQDHRLGFLVPN